VLFAPAAEEGLISRGTAVPTPVEPVPRGYDLMNILLLGGDDSLTNDGFARTDTMIIVSINRDTNTVSMLSLPRDMFVWLPSGQMNRLNVAYAVGENIGWTGGGFGLLRQTILYNFGINVHYYARVNFDGFREVIDTVGGIEVAVDCAYQDYPLIGAEVPGPAIETGEDGLWTLPIGYYNMTGAEALWYARTRANADDFDRGRRQQQIIFAIWRKVRASGVLSITSLPGLWDQATSAVETDLDFLDIAGLLPLALSLDVNEVDNFYLTRTYHTLPWQTPEGDFVQLPIYETLRPLLEDFYQPPPESQLAVTRPTVRVFNGTTNASWDRVAGERLEWEGFPATSAGLADTTDYAETVLIDYTGSQRGSGAAEIARLLNIRPENIILEPRADREADFDVILGANYDSCDAAVLDVEAP
jgi:LCP family protein required for cell wall assembly